MNYKYPSQSTLKEAFKSILKHCAVIVFKSYFLLDFQSFAKKREKTAKRLIKKVRRLVIIRNKQK